MHLRNSWGRSTSACCMRHVPSGASGLRGVNFWIFFLTSIIPGDVGDQILDVRERLHRFHGDRLSQVELIQPRHAHQPRLAVDLRRARSALPCLAVPAHGHVVGLRRLDLMHHVQHHHAGFELGGVIDELAAAALAAPDLESGLRSLWLFCSSMHLLHLIGQRDKRASARPSAFRPAPFVILRLYLPHSSLLSG